MSVVERVRPGPRAPTRWRRYARTQPGRARSAFALLRDIRQLEPAIGQEGLAQFGKQRMPSRISRLRRYAVRAARLPMAAWVWPSTRCAAPCSRETDCVRRVEGQTRARRASSSSASARRVKARDGQVGQREGLPVRFVSPSRGHGGCAPGLGESPSFSRRARATRRRRRSPCLADLPGDRQALLRHVYDVVPHALVDVGFGLHRAPRHQSSIVKLGTDLADSSA